MATKTTHIVAAMGFRKMTDSDLIARATVIETQMTGNANFPAPPVDLDVLKATIVDFSAAVAAALDGGKKQTADKHKVKDTLVKQLRQIATYVEATAQDDMAIFISGGVQARPPQTPAQPLIQPVVNKIDHGTTGQLVVRISPIRQARLYELRYAATTNGVPGPWTTSQLLSAKAYPVNGLTPGTIYAFQVRALNKAGYTNWSDSFTKMAT